MSLKDENFSENFLYLKALALPRRYAKSLNFLPYPNE